ncbi:zinc metalloprotease HtpX [Streptacidiphilus sp. PB12-B1b]|uniref:zinc metalloprotease HtpX n=1 Tax=Streptacidiphilus sp. PB12-B1b TaxID=2705012 RepID=UPI0015FDE3E9|nr:zinc metalloprotease HtpX [Streptacidiphilus sp. PB12-B1b]QMU77206.1 zinc metalloprotease HtpX [Streptacidiphilus sp. PB12-B1b]
MRSRFAPDRQLTVRMVTVVFLLGLLYMVFIAALVLLLKSAVLVVVVIGGLLAAQYWYSDRIALFAMRATEVSPDQQPHLHGALDRLCAAADMAKPRIAVADSALPNAFATGRNPDHAVLCVTTGLLDRLEPEELEGVLAHELSHIAHRDVAVITVASFLGVVAGLVARFALFSGLGRRAGPQAAVVFAAVMGAAVTVYSISFLLIRTLSRYRELAADRAAAQLTGRPSALASALVKVSADIARIPSRDLRTAQTFNAFFFAPTLGRERSLSNLFATHPSLQQRLDALARITARLGEPE